ncbi:MAG: All-trans-phytoene synthase [Verrucomicrobia subdivision 3 bacterium]|nr:All-trans-phytoene synthase [Limisphaerales bacterium]MCS1414865.1 All-trans-phytoene synthase [Limisphaerales bacterium]
MSKTALRTTESSLDSLLTDLLQAVSRSFYLTLKVLPAAVRRPISIGYLLAKTSDTIADTNLVEASVREASLNELARAIRGEAISCDFTSYLPHQTRSKERELLDRTNESVALLDAVDDEECRLIRQVLEVIISGQRLDLQRFRTGSPQNIVCLELDEELDDYTYRVAGCVGEFWTRICSKNLIADGTAPPSELIKSGIRFGKGLQLVNILRDVSDDLRQGRCYLPKTALQQAGIAPHELRLPSTSQQQIAPLFQHYARIANEHLLAGWEYTNQLPWRWIRVRLACAWPILIGFKTLESLPLHDPLNPERRAKISRRAVKFIIAKTLLAYPFPWFWRRLVHTK